jgi:hypothetical protein
MKTSDNPDYLLALGRLVQAYRDLDAKIFGISSRVFSLDMAEVLAIFGGSDPKRVLDTITRFFEEKERSRKTPKLESWRKLQISATKFIEDRNVVVHSTENFDTADKIHYFKLRALRPTFSNDGQYSHHNGIETWSVAKINTLADSMFLCSQELSEFATKFCGPNTSGEIPLRQRIAHSPQTDKE